MLNMNIFYGYFMGGIQILAEFGTPRLVLMDEKEYTVKYLIDFISRSYIRICGPLDS